MLFRSGRFKTAYPNLRFDGTISYKDSSGKSYSEPLVVDLSAHEGILYLGTKDINDIAKQIEEIASTLNRLATGFSKPLVRTITEAEHRAEEQELINEALRNQNPQPVNPNNPPVQ